MLISNPPNSLTWRATGLYGYPQNHNKFLTCQLINDLSCTNVCSDWLLFGDFNLVLTNEEKLGGNPLDPILTFSFRNTMNHCDLQDLGYNGNIFTWTNKHQGDSQIQCRLDRFLATSDWISLFPNYSNQHLLRYKSDHCPISLVFSTVSNNRNSHTNYYQKKFEQVWTTDDYHKQIVKEAWQHQQGNLSNKLHHTMHALHSWGSKTFGIIPNKIKVIQQDLVTLQHKHGNQLLTQQISQKEKELDLLRKQGKILINF
jgi:hypothetical protein